MRLSNPSERRDIGRLLDGIFLGASACILLYTAFGLVLVRIHAGVIAAKMELFLDNGMRALIAPDDPYLQSPIHQLGSALFFGIPLGTLTALFAAAVSVVPWARGRWDRTIEPLLTLPLIPLYLFLTFCGDAPVLSVLCAFLAPVFFWIPWIWVQRHREAKKRNRLRVAFFALLFLAPLASFRTFSSLGLRDMLMGLPAGDLLTNFYYDHTLLPAHVIKPVVYQTQKVVAIPEDVELLEPLLSGTLLIKAPDPCAVHGTSMVISRAELACPSFVLSPAEAHDRGQVIMWKASRHFDRNKALRRGSRWFFEAGFLAMSALLLLRFVLFVEDLYERRKAAALALLLAGLLLPARGLYDQVLLHALKARPYSRAQAFASSRCADKRYLSVVYRPQDLSQETLMKLSTDPNPRVRHYAFVAMGQQGDPAFLPALEKGMNDPEQIVRTKVYQALGRIGGEKAMRLLDRAISKDPSWYARHYAYEARGDSRHIYKIVERL